MDLRRHLTRRNLLRGLAAGSGLALIDGFGIEPHWLEVRAHELPVAGLPTALEGFTIAQITDAHLGGLGIVEREILATVNAANVQLMVLTGDLIDSLDDGPVLAELCAELGKTGARVVASLGNWEHWGSIPRSTLAKLYARSGAKLVVDEWEALDAGVALYVSDDSTGGSPRPLSPGPGAEVEILLTHSPAFVDEAKLEGAELGFDLCLAGHTHGGQITAAGLAPVLPPGSGRFVAGWYESRLGPVYVSRGTGTSLVPARFCCRPELPLFRLTRA